ncbi:MULTISPECIES: ethanolamine utilization protein EutH [Pseudomonas]|uniref:Ethanolamine utilization protein EutH n=1 Tax=Pseudomonas piscis TaxID=2614538 RepID=A0ABY9NEX9_9PSED|nr:MULTISPECIES: ethanolamine utilization protein EutH [Pseudomonas]POA55074.1 ethanolamine utilization protein EutH [Pseudomonas sp. FW507-12TSA]WMN17109.1 ethanolamine utilization protein EutH [Pseudomonas piscis]
MDQIGNYVLYLIMLCAVLGALAAIYDSDRGLGKEFMEGIHATGYIFVPAAGIMASIPYLTVLIESVFGPFFESLGADPALAATMIIASDMGGYHLASALAASKEALVMALITGFMGGATIVFSIPMGLAMLDKRDHKYMALGIMSGILTIPVGVMVASLILAFSNPMVRELVSTNSEASYQLALAVGGLFANLLPILIFVVALALGLRFLPDLMIKGFIIFGRTLDAVIKLVLVASIVQHFTGVFTTVFGSWGFHPIIADAEDQTRALETAGYIGIMLAGAFPMVYLLRKYLGKPLESLGGKVGLSAVGSAGMLATIANILAMFRLVRYMPPKDKVVNIAFGVCAAFLLGDHLSFTANFQPTIILPVLIGKLSAGFVAVGLAYWLSVPKALQLEAQDRAAGIIAEGEYLGDSVQEAPVGPGQKATA